MSSLKFKDIETSWIFITIICINEYLLIIKYSSFILSQGSNNNISFGFFFLNLKMYFLEIHIERYIVMGKPKNIILPSAFFDEIGIKHVR